MPTSHSGFPTKQLDVSYDGRVGARDHWRAHRLEFPEYTSARAYLEGAIEFCRAPSTRRFYYRRYGRPAIGYYDRETGTFAATSIDGETIFTYFRPGPTQIDAELRRWRMPENEKGERKMPAHTSPRHATPLRR